MTKSMLDLRAFTHLSILHRHHQISIYRLLYPRTVRYLQVGPELVQLLDHHGNIHSNDLEPLLQKIALYERLFSRSLTVEPLDNFLRLDEVRFLLDELLINNSDLEQQLERRLYDHLNQPYVRRYHQPLLLSSLLTKHDFVTNYLQTNIGLPEESDNYYNKLREMIEQIEEQVANVEPDYFLVLQTLLQLIDRIDSSNVTIALSTPYSSCILRTGSEYLPAKYHNFIVKRDPSIPSLEISNQFVFQSMKIYQELE